MRRPIRRILTPDERESLRTKERDLKGQLETPTLMMGDGGPVWVADQSGLEHPHQVQGELRKIRKVLEEGSAPDLTESERMERDKTIRILEERVRKRLVPERDFKMKDDQSTGYNKVVNELVNQGLDQQFGYDVEMLKNLRRERDPDNPSAGSIEDLRRS